MCTPATFNLYTLTGTLFLLFIYTLFCTQPFYIRGINDENLEKVKGSAFGGMMLFGVLWLVSLAWWWKSGRRGGGGRREGEGVYELIDDAGEDRNL